MFGQDKTRGKTAVLEAPQPGQRATPAPAAPGEAPGESLLGPSLALKGEVSFEDALVIEGEIHGKVAGQGSLTVGEKGRVTGDIFAANVIVKGRVQGNITAADRLEIAPSAMVVGDLHAARLLVGEGARLMGRLEIAAESLAMPAPRAHEEAPAAEDVLEKVL
jgi:cytoskeletal protein CcmA (bactofilin family)